MSQQIELTTYEDLIVQMIDYMGAEGNASARRDARRAIQSAMRIIPHEHRWSYYTGHGRISTVAAVSGSVGYTHTGGSSERLVQFSTAVVPEGWAAFGTLIIDDVMYEVAEWLSTSSLALAINSNPGADVASGASAVLFRDTYPLPYDFVSADEMHSQNALLEYVHPRNWLRSRSFGAGASTPSLYTISGDPNYHGAMALRLYPYSDAVESIDFMYQRRGRSLRVESESSGTVSVVADTKTVTGSGTTFTSDMVGSVIRIASDLPTGREGANPFDTERIIMSVFNSELLTVDQFYTVEVAGDKYEISDPLDIDSGVMLDAFLRLCEREVGGIRRMEGRNTLAQVYELALIRAKEADSRNTAPRFADLSGTGRFHRHSVGPDMD